MVLQSSFSRVLSFLNLINLLPITEAHLVSVSPWPILVRISIINRLLSLLLSMSGYERLFFFINITFLLLFLCIWFRDVIRENSFKGDQTCVVHIYLQIGMLLFILREVFFFFVSFGHFFTTLAGLIQHVVWVDLYLD